MRLRQIIGNLITIAILGAGVYGFLQWQETRQQDSTVSDFAEKACVDEIAGRYGVSNVKVNSIRRSANGFVVRTSVTTSRGTPAMAICLANSHGGVSDTSIEER